MNIDKYTPSTEQATIVMGVVFLVLVLLKIFGWAILKLMG